MIEDESDEEYWEEEETIDGSPVICLFCCETFPTANELWKHCKITHNFNIDKVKKKFRLEFYGYVKMVNYLRAKKMACGDVLRLTGPLPWDDDKYLHPFIEDDPLLQYDFDDSDEDSETDGNVCNGFHDDDVDEVDDRLYNAMQRARKAETALQQALADMEQMRAGMQNLVAGNEKETAFVRNKLKLNEDSEDFYFSSYSHYSIHEDMLKDSVRTLSYKNFMLENRHLFEDKVVLDVGCGSGILSIFAAKAGAKTVIAVDNSSIIYHAMDIVRENKLDHIIELRRGRVEDIDLNLKQVDVIISEWMGYFLLFESMLDTVLFARDKWLTNGGKVYPDRCTMSLVGVEDDKRMKEKIAFWDDVYGVKMTCMKNLIIGEPVIDAVDPCTTLTDSCVIKEIDVNAVKVADLDFKSDFKLKALRDGSLHIIVGYFDIFFEEDCINKITFSTEPSSPTTHWKQTLFFLERALDLRKDEVITGFIHCKKNKRDSRSLDITMELQSNETQRFVKSKYTLQ